MVNSLLVRFIPLLSAVGMATYAEANALGLFNRYSTPLWFEYAVILFLFDLLIYWQHVASHHVPLLWRFHRVHHADHDLDASSGLRFHPVEIALSMAIKCVFVLLVGAPPECVILFEVILNASAIFNHSNLRIPNALDSILRCVLVTPDMHRIHHSIFRDETNCNFGFNIPWWDRIFRTYRPLPRESQEQMQLGISEFPQTEQTVPIMAMLKMPFLKSPLPKSREDDSSS